MENINIAKNININTYLISLFLTDYQHLIVDDKEGTHLFNFILWQYINTHTRELH